VRLVGKVVGRVEGADGRSRPEVDVERKAKRDARSVSVVLVLAGFVVDVDFCDGVLLV